MAKRTRIISMLLALITVLGLLPLSLFAADTATENKAPDIIKHLDDAGIPQEDIIFASDLDAPKTEVFTGANYQDYYATSIDGAIAEHSKTLIRPYYGVLATPVMGWKTDGNNKYLGFTTLDTATKGLSGYFDLINRGVTGYSGVAGNGLLSKISQEVADGNRFVFSIDVKLQASSIIATPLFTMMTRNTAGSDAVSLVYVDNKGALKTYIGASTYEDTGFSLAENRWTTVAVAVDMVTQKFDLYIDNFLAKKDAEFNKPLSYVDSTNTSFIVPTCMRLYQITASESWNKFATANVAFDNVVSYYAPNYVENSNVNVIKEAVADGAIFKDIALITDFEGFSSELKTTNATASYLANGTAGGNVFSGDKRSYIQLKYNSPDTSKTPAYEWVTEADGNTAIKANGYSTQTFIDIVHKGITDGVSQKGRIEEIYNLAKDKTLVFRVNVKAGESLNGLAKNITLVNLMTRNTGPNGVNVININAGNKLFAAQTDLKYSLPTDKYVTLEIRLNVASGAYNVYADGVKLTSAPLELPSTCAMPGYDQYVMTAARMLQSAPACEGMLYLDDIAFYYTDTRSDVHKNLSAAGVSSSDIVLVTDLDNFANTTYAANSVNALYYANDAGFAARYNNLFRISFAKAATPAIQWKEENGNKYIQTVKYDVDTITEKYEGFTDISTGGTLNMSGITGYIGARMLQAINEGKKLNFSMDVKGADYITSGALITLNTRTYNASNTETGLGGQIVGVDASGKLVGYDWSTGKAVAVSLDESLSNDKFTSIGVSIDIKNFTFTVYVNGVVCPKTFSLSSSWVTPGYDYMIPNAFRIYHRISLAGEKNLFAEDSLSFDNFAVYYSENYVGANNGTVEGYKLSLNGNIGVQTYVSFDERISTDKVLAKFTIDGITTEQTLDNAELTEYGYKLLCELLVALSRV